MIEQQLLTIQTEGRGAYDFTDQVQRTVKASAIDTGMCHLFLRHTSASLMICENADPSVLRDLESFMSRMVVDGDPLFTHTAEGPDDMSAHVRSILTHTDLNVPVTGNQCGLGTWQGIFLWEHRYAAHERQVVLTVSGE